MVLKNKIVESTQIPVTIPSFGEKYTLNDELTVKKEFEEKIDKRYMRLQIIDRMETLQEEIEDMKNIVKEDMLGKERSDKEIEALNEKVKELEKKIVEIIES